MSMFMVFSVVFATMLAFMATMFAFVSTTLASMAVLVFTVMLLSLASFATSRGAWVLHERF